MSANPRAVSRTGRLRLGIGIALVLGACLVAAGCTRGPAEAPAAEPGFIPVSHPVQRYVTDHADFTARLAAVDSVDVKAHVWGYLDRVNFKEGSLVKKGDVLCEIDQRTYRAALHQAEGNLAQLEARVERLNSDLARARRMVPTGAMSREDYDKTVGDHSSAKRSWGRSSRGPGRPPNPWLRRSSIAAACCFL